VGFPDSNGLVARENIIGIWPKENVDIFHIAGLINAPLANAFLYSKGHGRDNAIETLQEIPIPHLLQKYNQRGLVWFSNT